MTREDYVEPSRRRADEEPDFGDPDYKSGTDIYGDPNLSGTITDAKFDSRHPGDASRIKEQLEQAGEDPTGRNLEIRNRNGKVGGSGL